MAKPPSDSERILRGLPCAQCGAQPGERCISDRGRKRSGAHKARFDEAWDRNLFPIQEAMKSW